MWALFGTENSHYLFYCLMMNTCKDWGGGLGGGSRADKRLTSERQGGSSRGRLGTPLHVCVSGFILTDMLHM